MELRLERRDDAGAACPYCREVVASAQRVSCACGVHYHAACLAELRGCVTVGCAEVPRAPSSLAAEDGGASRQAVADAADELARRRARRRRPAPRPSLGGRLLLGVLAALPAIALVSLLPAEHTGAGAVIGLVIGMAAMVIVMFGTSTEPRSRGRGSRDRP